MKTYYYKTDSGSGEIEAESLAEALRDVCREEAVSKRTISNGAWAWVEDVETGEREYVAKHNM